MRNEVYFKTQLVNYFYKNKKINFDSIVATELPINSFERRADLVTFNSGIHIFEIKSDIDTLDRLDGQISTFKKCANKVTVVCSPKYTDSVKNRVPKSTGIWVLDEYDRIKVIREASYRKIRSKSILSDYINVIELRKIIRRNNIKIKSSYFTRVELLHLIKKVTLDDLHNEVLEALKQRYQANSNKLFNNLENKGRISGDDIEVLNRKSKPIANEIEENSSYIKDLFFTSMGSEKEKYLFGPIPAHLERYITN